MARPSAGRLQLTDAIAELEDLPTDVLRERWKEYVRSDPPTHASRGFLMRNLAYRMQEQALGSLSPGLRSRLKKLAREIERDPGFTLAPTPAFKPGTRLIRGWKGEVHEVEILKEGFAWRGQRYGSLSEIAREITGTRWSGPAFFGLKKLSCAVASHGN